jgi:hypothetical protein
MVLAADTMCGATDASSLFRTVAADPGTVSSSGTVSASGDGACGCQPVASDQEAASSG